MKRITRGISKKNVSRLKYRIMELMKVKIPSHKLIPAKIFQI
jgi:hypothetical protein